MELMVREVHGDFLFFFHFFFFMVCQEGLTGWDCISQKNRERKKKFRPPYRWIIQIAYIGYDIQIRCKECKPIEVKYKITLKKLKTATKNITTTALSLYHYIIILNHVDGKTYSETARIKFDCCWFCYNLLWNCPYFQREDRNDVTMETKVSLSLSHSLPQRKTHTHVRHQQWNKRNKQTNKQQQNFLLFEGDVMGHHFFGKFGKCENAKM
jgi:hypothetical protein